MAHPLPPGRALPGTKGPAPPATVTRLLRDAPNDLEAALRVRQLLDAGEPVQALELHLGRSRVKLLLGLLRLPPEVQELIRMGRLTAGTAVRMARELGDAERLKELVLRGAARVEELCAAGRRHNRRITQRVLGGRHTVLKILNDLAAQLKTRPLPGAEHLQSLVHGLQRGLDAPAILDALERGEHIAPLPPRRRGRPPKTATGPAIGPAPVVG